MHMCMRMQVLLRGIIKTIQLDATMEAERARRVMQGLGVGGGNQAPLRSRFIHELARHDDVVATQVCTYTCMHPHTCMCATPAPHGDAVPKASTRGCLHICMTQYPKRAHVDAEHTPWSKEWDDYSPVEHTMAFVTASTASYKDHEDASTIDFRARFASSVHAVETVVFVHTHAHASCICPGACGGGGRVRDVPINAGAA